MVMAVLFEALGGGDRFPAGPRTLLRWFQSGRNRLSRIKKWAGQQLARWCHGQGCVVRSPKGARIDSRLGRELFYVGFGVEETD